MKPGRYLELRREAAGLSIEDVATLIGWPSGAGCRAFDRLVVHMLEANRMVAPIELLERLRGAFPFDPYVYLELGFGHAIEICRSCGCSALDACDHEHDGPCAWADAAIGADGLRLCTSCQSQPQECRNAA